MSAADHLRERLTRPDPREQLLSVLIRESGALWQHVLTSPADDITDLHLVTAVNALCSPRVCDEFIGALSRYSDITFEGYGNIEPVSEDPDDATLGRLVWVTGQLDHTVMPGVGNLLVCLGYAFTEHGDVSTASVCVNAAARAGADEALVNALTSLLEPVLSDDDDLDDDDYDDGEEYADEDWDEEYDDEGEWESAPDERAHGDGDAAPPETGADRWWAEREATHQDGPALDFDTDAWEARLIEPQPGAPERDAADITQPLPVVKPVLDPDVHDRRRGRRWRGR